jgi:2-isopropylmalate synthase
MQAAGDAVCLVAKSWDYHVKVALGRTNEENLADCRIGHGNVIAAGKEAMVDCEHFFDGYKANPDYALALCANCLRGRGALGRVVRHQWRHAALRRSKPIVTT